MVIVFCLVAVVAIFATAIWERGRDDADNYVAVLEEDDYS